MTSLFINVLLMSVTGLLLTLCLAVIQPVTKRKLSATWHYRMYVLVVLFLLVPIGLVGSNIFTAVQNTTEQGFPNVPSILNDMMAGQQATILPQQPGQVPLQTGFITTTPSTLDAPILNSKIVLSFLPIVWFAGFLLFVIWHSIQLVRFKKKIIRTSLPVENVEMISIMETLMAEMGIKSRLYLLSNDIIKTPMLTGLFKTYLLLPEVDMSGRELNIIFKHELTHFRRRDLWVKSLTLLANDIHWFNPFAYRLTKSVNTFCELSCDEQVVSDMGVEERQFYGETILNVLCRVANQHSGVYATLAESKKGIERRLTHMMNVKKNPKRIVLMSIAAAVILCLIGFALASFMNLTGENRTNKEAEQIVGDYMADIIGDDPQKAYYGEYSIDGIEQIGNYIYATAQYHPNEGQGSVYLFILEENSGKLSIIDKVQGDLPLSMGVELYKETFSNKTAVFGTVNDQLWFDLDGSPQKIDFTEIKALYSNGKEKTVKVKNFQSFLICIDGDVTIEDVLFLSGNEVVGKLSELPISENVMDNFNAHGDPYTFSNAGEAQRETEVKANITAKQLDMTISVPVAWEDIAIIETNSDAEAPSSGAGNDLLFQLYEKTAYTTNKSMGLVWSLHIFTHEALKDTFGELDSSEIIGIANYMIGSDDKYVYLLSLPSDVQFLEDSPESEEHYRQLQIESQAVLESFLNDNHITVNEKCPNSPVFQVSAS